MRKEIVSRISAMRNDIFEVEHPYIPPTNFRSQLGRILWDTFASDEVSGWKNGEINRPLPEDGDDPLLHDFPSTSHSLSTGDWVIALIEAIDQLLPATEILLECL